MRGPHQAVLGVIVGPVREGEGVRVLDVLPGGPADEAGIRPGDVIQGLDGRNVTDLGQFMSIISEKEPGNKVKVAFSHQGSEKTATTTLASRDVFSGESTPQIGAGEGAWLGIVLRRGTAQQKGAVVADVYPASPAARAGLREGDVITQAGSHKIATPEDLIKAVDSMKPGEKVSLTVQRNNKTRTLEATLGAEGGFFGPMPFRAYRPPMEEYREGAPPVPPGPMMHMENERRAAEQRQRIEKRLNQLSEQIQKLHQEVQKLQSRLPAQGGQSTTK
jgi:predicted metalloprotease with PDZ domain